MQQEFVDFRSLDRTSGQGNDFVFTLPRRLSAKKLSSIGFSNLELPSTRYTVEEKENALAVGEGVCIGDHAMARAENEIVFISRGGARRTAIVPATLMPATLVEKDVAFHEDGSVRALQTKIVTAQAHGLEEYLRWGEGPGVLVVGAELSQSAADYFRGGLQLSAAPGLEFPPDNRPAGPDGKKVGTDPRRVVALSPYVVRSLRVGTVDRGFLHCPPLHLQEIVGLLNHQLQGAYRFSLDASVHQKGYGAVRVEAADGGDFYVSGVDSPTSLLRALGLSSQVNYRAVHYAVRNPEVMRLRVPGGYYSSPPSLFGNAVEAALQARGSLMPSQATQAGHEFQVSILDATYNQKIVVPLGVYTPEKLVATVQSMLSTVRLTVEHVSDRGYENVGWVRYTFESPTPFPFVLDFSGAKAQRIAFALGFESRRYTSQSKYTGTPIAVPATRNVAPCPPVSYDGAGLRAPLPDVLPAPRYLHGLYTIVGTTPTTQAFQIICEPGRSWAVPNKGKAKDFFNNVEGAGVLDLSTRALPQQQSYDFREGDVVRLTGYHKREAHFNVVAQSTDPAKPSRVTGIHADGLGGKGYVAPPAVTVSGEFSKPPKRLPLQHVVVSHPEYQPIATVREYYEPVGAATGTQERGTATVRVAFVPRVDLGHDPNTTVLCFEHTERQYQYLPGQFSYREGTLTVPDFVATADPEFTVLNLRLETVLVATDRRVEPGRALAVDSPRGAFSLVPVAADDAHFCANVPFAGDYAGIVDARAQAKDGYAVFSALRPTAQTVVALAEEVGKEVAVDGETVRVLGAEKGTAKTTLPASLRLAPLRVVDFAETVLVAKGAPHAFLAQAVTLDGEAVSGEHRFSQTGSVAYEATGVPATMAVQHPNFAGVYAHAPTAYQPFLYALGGKTLYLYRAGGEGGQWRFCDSAVAPTSANPRHPNYGKASTPFTEHLDAPFAGGEAWAFSEAETFRGTFLVLDVAEPYSRRADQTMVRGSGMEHPTVRPVLFQDRVVAFDVSGNAAATYVFPPTVTVAPPSAAAVSKATVARLSFPERTWATFEVDRVPPALVVAGAGVAAHGFVAVLDEEKAALVVGATSASVTVQVDFDGAAEWAATVKSLRIAPGRAVFLETSSPGQGRCRPSMPALVCRQEHWGQEMPMKYAGVRAVREGQAEAVAAVRMSGDQAALAFAVEHAEGPELTVRQALPAEERPLTGVTVEGTTLAVHTPELANLHIGDHVSIEGVANVRILRISLPDRIVLDVDARATPYWQSVSLEGATLTVDTRRYVLDGVFTHGTVQKGSTVRVGDRLLEVDRFSGIITHETSYLYLNDPGHPDVEAGTVARLGAPSLRMTSAEDVDWAAIAPNGALRLKGGLQGTFRLEEAPDARTARLEARPGLPISGQATAIKAGKIVVERVPTATAPVVGEKIVIAGTHRAVPPGPYTGQASCPFGHADQRGFDGVWTVTRVDGNDVEIGFDGAFDLDEDLEFPGPHRPTIARLAEAGTHAFSESLFLSGFDIAEGDASWTWRCFRTFEANTTDVGVGGFAYYDPRPSQAHAVVRASHEPLRHRVEAVFPAMPGFVSKHDDPTTPEPDIVSPPVKIAYAEGVASQLRTDFDGATPPRGHARATAHVENGHVVPTSLFPNGPCLTALDGDGREVTYQVVAAYVPGRITHEAVDGQTMTLLNAHRLRLVLSEPLQGRLQGVVAVKNAPMFEGQFAVPDTVLAPEARCDGAGRIFGCPDGVAVGMRVSSKDIEEGRYVGSVEAAGDGTFTVGMFPADTDFSGTTEVAFEDVDATVPYQTFEPAGEGAVQNYNLGAAAAVPTGRMVVVPPEGTKTARGAAAPAFDDGRYRIPPRLAGREVEIVSAVPLYGGKPGAPHTPNRWFEQTGQGGATRSWGPLSVAVSDDELSVPTVCFPGSQCAYFSTHLEVTFGGDYVTPPTAQFNADATMTVVSKNETRVGVVTLSTFDAFHKFRLLFEYNPNGLNGGKGFDDTTTPGDNVFFTFSRVFEPRLELLPEHTDAFAIFGSSRKVKDMAFAYDVRNDDWPDMFAGPSDDGHPLLARQRQQIAGLLGATKNLFGRSAYVLPAQWNLDPKPYRILVVEPFRETLTGHTTLCTKTDDDLDGTIALGDRTSNANVFMKIPIPSAYNVPGPQPRQLQLSPPVHVEKIRIRVLDHDLTPYPMHGREMTISLVFDGGKIVGRRNP